MEFIEITEDVKATPGEYIYHLPTKQIVLCGAFNRSNNMIRALSQGKLFTDTIANFKKIKLKSGDRLRRSAAGCKGCGM
jgi:hypothetical protein